MPFFDLLLERTMDAFTQHPMFFIYGVISITGIIVLWFDLNRFKNNQVSRQVSSRIGKTGEKKEFDITIYFSKFLSKQEEKVKADLEKANVLFTVKEYMTVMILGGFFGAIVGMTVFPLATMWKSMLDFLPFAFTQELVGRTLCGAILGFAGSFAPKLYLMYLIDKRRKLLIIQMQDALLNVADALRSGHVIGEAIKIVGYESPYPIGDEFSRASREMEAGSTLEKALQDLKRRIDIADFTMAINAVEIQYEVGGKLEPLLRNMVKVISDRQELKKEIEKTIASSKMVGIILLCAPIFFAVVFTSLNKEQFDEMFTNLIGQLMIIIAIISYVVAAWIIIAIIRSVSKDI